MKKMFMVIVAFGAIAGITITALCVSEENFV